MEVMVVTFDPPEPIGEGDTLNKILERRFVQGFELKNTFGLPKKYTGEGTYYFSLDYLAGKPTHEYSLQMSDTMAAVCYRRQVQGRHTTHTLVTHEGKDLLREDNGIYFLHPQKEFGNTSQIGIARRGRQGLELEYYLSITA